MKHVSETRASPGLHSKETGFVRKMIVDSEEADVGRPGMYCTVSHAGKGLQEGGSTWSREPGEIRGD